MPNPFAKSAPKKQMNPFARAESKEDPWPGWHPFLLNGQWVVLGSEDQLCPEPNTWSKMGYGEAMRRALEMNRPWVLRMKKKHKLH